VGKTSLGRSIARAMGRKFVRVSLGGIRDEAEVRGHRRTYVGAMPGRILQALHQAGTANPVLLLDEIDKLGTDGRSDPSAALLEVLDPEQNTTFRDHYLALPYDLSKVLFLATANLLDPIHPAFLDRLEVVRLSGYTIEEKVAIAKRHLIPRQRAAHGLTAKHLRFTDAGVRAIADGWTREAGLRQLEREIAALCRRSAMRVAEGDSSTLKIGPRGLEPLLGAPRYLEEERLEAGSIGVATGLAWTAVGGETMLVEIAATPGKGQLTLTGQLGDVMKESAQAALTCVRSLAPRLGISATYFAEHDLHVHVPAGAIPKDGPSAGITIATALTSLASGRSVDRDVAMTGEITLRGRVLPIGGLREKVLAARASKIATVLVPAANHRDGAELPPEIREGVELVYVRSLEEVLARALGPAPGAPSK
jgi:ATP-dependent Lon protease